MTKEQTQLAAELFKLSLRPDEKVCLWLTYKNLKPVSAIGLPRQKKQKDKLFQWLTATKLNYSKELNHDNYIHVSLDPKKAKLSSQILHKFDYKNELASGRLFGFPEKAVEAYAKNRQSNTIPMVGDRFQHPYLKDKYFTPYMMYSARTENVEEDSITAKSWADTIRNDIPQLAVEFENFMEQQTTSASKKISKRVKVPLSAKLSRQEAKQIVNRVLDVFFAGNMSTTKLSQLSKKILKKEIDDHKVKEIFMTAEKINELEKTGEETKLASKLKQLLNWYKSNKG